MKFIRVLVEFWHWEDIFSEHNILLLVSLSSTLMAQIFVPPQPPPIPKGIINTNCHHHEKNQVFLALFFYPRNEIMNLTKSRLPEDFFNSFFFYHAN